MTHCLLFAVNDVLADRTSGIHRTASHLRESGWDCEVIDFVFYWTSEELLELVKSRVTSKTKFIGLSYLWNRAETVHKLKDALDWAKSKYPDLIVISGGQSQLVDYTYTDYHIFGYGENALDALLKWKFSNGVKPKFDLLSNNPHKVINAIRDYPAYPKKNAVIKYEDRDFIMPGEWGRIEFSRGCIFSCKFCNFPILGVKEDYTRDTDNIREQLMDAYDRFGIENYLITDETFNDRTDKITRIADVVDTLPWKPYFSGFIRADLLINRPKDREELLRMGMLGHFYGIESLNPETAKFINKGHDVEKMKAGLVEVKNYFKQHTGNLYRANISLIAGLPYETLESLEDTYQWIKNNWRDQVSCAGPLELLHKNDPRRSELSLDLDQYHYEEIPAQVSTKPNVSYDDKSKSDEQLIVLAQTGTNRSFAWKNPNMDIFQAWDWCVKVDNLYKVGGRNMAKMEGYLLSRILCDEDGTPLTLQQKLKLVEDTAKPHYKYFEIFVNSYKDKKLNYAK
jgi:radical SAM superfamily enzyme YgiQ (UPF0313 family)